jgi:dihydroorotate dehydrogenase (NAD+) catalytic subunit
MIDLSIQIAGMTFSNPVMVASGTFGYAEEFSPFFDVNRLGAVITKTVTLEQRPGNSPPRIAETRAGMLNSIGLPNVGVEKFIVQKMPFLHSLSTKIIINIAGKTIDEFVAVVSRLDQVDGIAAYELNYSCPNVKEGGMSFSADPHMAETTTRQIRQATHRPLIAKLTPNVTSISQIGLAVQNGGADAVSAVNTFVGMAVDIRTRKPKLATITGGCSGPAIKSMALAKVYELVRTLSIPVIAIGGIMNTDDALEFLISGAAAIQVGPANFVNPCATIEIIDGLINFCMEKNISHIQQIIGTLCID